MGNAGFLSSAVSSRQLKVRVARVERLGHCVAECAWGSRVSEPIDGEGIQKANPKALGTHILRLSGPKTIL